MNEKILFVDDEPAVLEGYRRILHREFSLASAVGGAAGLRLVAEAGDEPYAVVVSDMRMPEMDGVQFLAQVRMLSPDTVRMALTGHADIETAMNAVNESAIFRFLAKPCSKEILGKALTAGLIQYRLQVAEKELLEKTLHGSIQVLTEVLSLVNPAAFSRGLRIRRYVQHIVGRLQLKPAWQFEIAAMMSQLGCVTLDTDTIEAIYAGRRLSPEEQARFDAHPSIAGDLLSNIPRLEPIARMIAYQNTALPAAHKSAAGATEDVITVGARILRVALAYDQLLNRGSSHDRSLEQLRAEPGKYEGRAVDALADLTPEPQHMDLLNRPVAELECDMILQQDVRTESGLLVVAKGQPITYPLLVRLKNFRDRKAIPTEVLVLVPRELMADAKPTAKAAPAG